MMPPDGIPRLLRYFDDPAVGCVCGHLIYVNPDETATSRNGAAYWRLEEYTKRLESETGSVIGADGSLFAIQARAASTRPRRNHRRHVPVPGDPVRRPSRGQRP
ncbi:MAG: hypothetical protein WDO24_23670 [Pseudomonadota bacterium]